MNTEPRHSPPPRDAFLLALVGLPVVGAVTTLAVLGHLTTWALMTESVGAVVFDVVFLGWALLPFAAAVAVGVSVRRHWPRGTPAALVGGLLLVVVTVWSLWGVLTSESSTAVLGLLFAPLVQAAVAGLTMAAAVGVARLRRRGTARAA